jgi:hypothetical protein
MPLYSLITHFTSLFFHIIIIITIPSNKPDIVIRDYEKGTCMLLDVAIPGDRNLIQNEAEKILKYKDLTIEM